MKYYICIAYGTSSYYYGGNSNEVAGIG